MIHGINFERGRILPSLSASTSLGAEIYKSELNGRLKVLAFNGLFSGNAIAPGRSFSVRLDTSF